MEPWLLVLIGSAVPTAVMIATSLRGRRRARPADPLVPDGLLPSSPSTPARPSLRPAAAPRPAMERTPLDRSGVAPLTVVHRRSA